MSEASNHIGVYIRLHKVHDDIIIKRLKEQTNKQGYIKGLIKKDAYKQNNKKGEAGNE